MSKPTMKELAEAVKAQNKLASENVQSHTQQAKFHQEQAEYWQRQADAALTLSYRLSTEAMKEADAAKQQ